MRTTLESTLRGHLARRLFILFLCAALLPMAGLALIAYQQVSDALINLNYLRLQQDAKSLGMGVIQRLGWRTESLKNQRAAMARDAGETPGPPGDLVGRKSGISALKLVERHQLAALSAEQWVHLSQSNVLMQLTPDGSAEMTIAIDGASSYLKAHLVAEAVWRDDNAGGNYCIFTRAGMRLFCSPGMSVPPADHWLAGLQSQQNSGVFSWRVSGEDHLAAFWQIPLQAILAHEGLLVVVSENRDDVLAVLVGFRQFFPAIVVLAMALAAGLAVSQIRRQMRPLVDLEKHAAQLAHGDFSSRIEVEGDDEFSRLAESFNHMSDRLNHKFHLLQSLGELDRAILTLSDLDSVVRLLLLHVQGAVTCDHAGVLCFDQDRNALYCMDGIKPVVLERSHPLFEGGLLFSMLDVDDSWLELDLAVPENRKLALLIGGKTTRAFIFPARVEDRLDSALVLAYEQAPREIDEIVQAGRSLADRLVTAAINISWGDKLYHQANFDALTDLPNRTLLRDRMEQALLRAERKNLAVALIVIDLDRFKDINDSLGHAAGDALLVSCARRIRHAARHSDTVARLGGDEFIVVVSDLPRTGAAIVVDRIATSLSTEISLPVDLGTHRISAPASIGIALYPDNGTDIHELMKNADAAMYESKRQHHGGYRFYSEEMNAEIKSRFEIMQNLRNALDNNEFFLVYQPKIDATTGGVVGAEALVRWASPRFGLVFPGQFIPMIDEIGLESRLGHWVIDTACAQAAEWIAQGNAPLPVSVNISPTHFQSREIVMQVCTALSRNNLAADLLELEILETTAMGYSDMTNDILTELRSMNVGIALDDFGTGYSSLVYLTRLPANVLKIDRGFILDLLTDSRKKVIVKQIISLAKVLNFKVVAEGVEDEAQIHALTAMGCDIFQGYFFSKPLSPELLIKFRKDTEKKLAFNSVSSRSLAADHGKQSGQHN